MNLWNVCAAFFRPKGHPSELKQAKWCDDGCLWDVLLIHMIGTNEVYLGEDFGAVQGCREVVKVWNGVPVGSGVVVESAVVTTGSPVTRLLGHHM